MAIATLLAALLVRSGPAWAQGGAAEADTATPAQQQAQAEARRDLSSALGHIAAGERDAALAILRRVAEQDDAQPALRYTAGLWAGQIAGTFNARQKRWLDREVVDAVVLVPDERSLLAAIRTWNERRFFPVLIEDDWFAPMFIAAFKPAKVVRFEAPSAARADGGQDDEAREQAVRDIAEQHAAALARARRADADQPPPPGLVVIDPAHRHRGAALALAIGRDQPVHLYAPPDLPNQATMEQISPINQAIMGQALRQRLVSDDQWCGITLAGDYPEKVKAENGPLAFDDVIGRDSRGMRLAVIGRLQGNLRRSVYQAMSSLFLQPDRALLGDDYSRRSGRAFAAYRSQNAADLLDDRLDVVRLADEDVSARRLRDVVRAADPFDLIWINSSGGPTRFAFNGNLGPDDLPLGHPAAYYFVHSFAAANVNDANTIGGRALANGAYWFFGSLHEPYLHAFVEPTGFAMKVSAGTPLAFAARHTPGHRMYRPWKLAVYGDPLFCLRDKPARRVKGPLPAGVEALDPPDHDDPIARLRYALLAEPDEVADRAAAAVRADVALPADLLRWAAVALLRSGQAHLLLQVPAEQVRGEPLARRHAVWQADDLFEVAVEAGDVSTARRMLLYRLTAGGPKDHLVELARTYVVAAGKKGIGDVAAAELRKLAGDDALPEASRQALQEAVTPADDAR